MWHRLLFVAMLLSFACSSFIIFNRPVGTCGPFTGLGLNTTDEVRFMYNVVPFAVGRGADDFQSFWDALFGRGVVAPILLLLLAFTYYWQSKLSGQRLLINELRYRAYIERVDHKAMARGQKTHSGSKHGRKSNSKKKDTKGIKPNRR